MMQIVRLAHEATRVAELAACLSLVVDWFFGLSIRSGAVIRTPKGIMGKLNVNISQDRNQTIIFPYFIHLLTLGENHRLVLG